MTADQRPAFAVIDEALFGHVAIPATARDVRSVGEMLVDVDCLARHLLMDVSGDDAPGLVRGWPRVVAAADQLWMALPGRRPVLDERDVPMQRLAAQAATVNAALSTTVQWPGPGPDDERLTQLEETLLNAAALVRRYGADVRHERPAAHRDLEAVRARIMHGLYVSTHAVSVALYAHGRDRYDDARSSGRPLPLARRHSPYAVAPMAAWISRMNAAEQVARRYLGGRFGDAFAEAPVPAGEPNRVARALAGWDIQAHRSLVSRPTPGNLHLIGRTQSLILGTGMLLIEGSQRVGDLEDTERLASAVVEAARCWGRVASRWGDLNAPGARLDGQLVRAAAEVRAAYRVLTHDTTRMADPEVIASRAGAALAAGVTLWAMEGFCELAHVVAEKAHQPGLVGPARAMSIRAHNDIEQGFARPHPDGDYVWVPPADIQGKRIVPIPPPVAEALRNTSAELADASSTAAAVSLQFVEPSRLAVEGQRPVRSSGQRVWVPETPRHGSPPKLLR